MRKTLADLKAEPRHVAGDALAPVIPVSVSVPEPEPDPVVFGATARLESDPAATVAPTAAPRGPEIRVSAWLEPGDGAVRELPAETAPDELTEESK